jgi:cardiolipin synthase
MSGDIGWIIGFVAAVATVGGVVAAFHAVMSARTSQGAVAWAIALVALPYVALPLYLVLGRNKFRGYVDARRAGDARVEEYIRAFRERFDYQVPIAGWDKSYEKVLETLSRLPFSGFNRTRLLVDGQEAFGAIFRGIDGAKDYVLVQFFIIKDDSLGRDLKDRLVRKAREGAQAYLLYDEIGCHKLPSSYLDELRGAGVRVSAFRTRKGRGNRFQINFRNHRKIVVVDGRLAFVGGLNVGDEYMGKSPKFGRWRDTHLEVEGPAVMGVQATFVEDWHWATGNIPKLNWKAKKSSSGGTHVLVLPTGPADRLESCALFFSESINRAKKRVWIASPYFVPDLQIMTSLQLAALRGVDVRIMLPGKPDHLLIYLSSFSYIKQVEPVGVKFYRYESGFLHQKVIVVDDEVAGIGTANLDNRSFRLNFEITMVSVDKDFAAEAAAMLEEDFTHCRQVHAGDYDDRPFWFKVAVQTSRLLAPIQ